MRLIDASMAMLTKQNWKKSSELKAGSMPTTKYLDTQIVFAEIPDEITLAINITNCPFRCPDCHSPELQRNIGNNL